MAKKQEIKPDGAATAPAEISERAAQIFKSYPGKMEVFFTSDGLAFFEYSDAKNHADTLKDKTVEKETAQKE